MRLIFKHNSNIICKKWKRLVLHASIVTRLVYSIVIYSIIIVVLVASYQNPKKK